MNWYLGITTSKMISPFPGHEKIRGEAAVETQLLALGLDCFVPTQITFKRRGKNRYSPLEAMEYVNTPGEKIYAMNVPDRDRNMWTKGEIYSYPLYVCQRPSVLRRANRQGGLNACTG